MPRLQEQVVNRCRCTAGRDRSTWVVLQRRCNHSAFNGYRWTPSDYSDVQCVAEQGGCGARWRTKAAYVDQLPDSHPYDYEAP